MLSKEGQKKLLKAMRLSDAAITAIVDNDKENNVHIGLTDAEIAKIPDAEKAWVIPGTIKVLDDTELATRDTVKIGEGKAIGLTEGETTAIGVFKGEIIKAGIEIKKDRIGDIVQELKAGMNASNDSKIKTLTEQNTALLADNNTFKTKATEAETALNKGRFDLDVMGRLPGIAPGMRSLNETLALMKMRGYEIEKTDAGEVIKQNGEVLKNTNTHAPLAINEGLAHVWATEKWTAAPPPPVGRGGKQGILTGGTGGVMNKTQAIASFEEANPGKNIMSPEGQAYYRECAKTEGFNMYE